MRPWILADGFNLAYRAFYGMPELTRSDGLPTGAIHGWLRTLWKIEDDWQPEALLVFFDLGGAKRHLELLPEYKANRVERPEGFDKQLPWIKQITRELGWGALESEGIEADDLIGSAARHLSEEGKAVKIASADKDFAQCVKERVSLLLPPPTANPKIGWRSIDEKGVEEKFGVPPKKIPDYLALIGDASDNIPGLKGVGPKTAVKWISQYGGIEGILANSGLLKPQRFQRVAHESADLLRRNLELVRLDPELACPKLQAEAPSLDAAVKTLEALEMPRSVDEARRRLGGA